MRQCAYKVGEISGMRMWKRKEEKHIYFDKNEGDGEEIVEH